MDTPYTLLQLKIDHAVLERARTKVRKLRSAHDEEIDRLKERIKDCATEKQAAKLHAEWDRLHERGRRITLHNVVRVAIDLGILDLNVQDALEKIEQEGTPLGRPRRIAG